MNLKKMPSFYLSSGGNPDLMDQSHDEIGTEASVTLVVTLMQKFRRMSQPCSVGQSKQHRHKDVISCKNISPLSSELSPEWIFLSTLDTAYQITLGSPVPGPIFSMRCWTV
jgi:hypothetical protein